VFDSNCGYWNCEFMQVLFEDVASDPTLSRTKSVHCAACGPGEVFFFLGWQRAVKFDIDNLRTKL